jgi:thymidine kinase
MAKLYFKYGTMESGKSTKIIQEAYNYDRNNKSIIVAKPIIDSKGNDKIVSRIGIQRKIDVYIESDNLKEIYEKINKETFCILIDEAQFLNKNQVFELFKITKLLEIPVMCYGLKSNFKGEFFEGSEALMIYADSLEEIVTICSCGKKARFNARKVNGDFVTDGEDVLIDGSNENVEYVPLCGECYIKKVKKLQK